MRRTVRRKSTAKATRPPEKPGSVFGLPVIQDFLKECDKVTIKPGDYVAELLNLHNGRKSPKLKLRRTIGPESVREAYAHDQHVRSRALGIMLECRSILTDLDTMRASLVMRIINTEVAKMMPVTTKTDRTAFLNQGLRKRAPVLVLLKKAEETATYIIEDIDKAQWALRGIVTTFELASRPELTL